MLSTAFSALLIGAIILTIIIVLRQDQLAAVVVIAVHLYVDWYLGLALVAHVLALALLVFFFLSRSPRFPWGEPRALWLWGLFLILTIAPATRGALTPHDTLNYYPNIVLGALIMFWLGTVIARDTASVRRFFQVLSLFGSLIAVHTIVQTELGITLLGSSQVDAYLTTTSNYQLVTGAAIYRLGSFFVDPNWNGTFLAVMLFIPLGLFVESSSLPAKVLYVAEALIILPALLFTYSTGAWTAACAGVVAFIVLNGRSRYRIQFSLLIGLAIAFLFLWFPDQLALLSQHATGPDELSLRIGAWETALRVIAAYPLTGIGLGRLAYQLRAEPYRVPAQYIPLDHPHNAYLEYGAMGGLPVLLVFLALLLFALWQALRNWTQAAVPARALLGGGIAAIVTLSVNSWSIDGWTLPPLVATGWLLLGALSSPLLRQGWYPGSTGREKSLGAGEA
ncbi:MAG TPA: O-antigen ligase family protein [Ktedonobacteraceae bacterium]|nr:O-antigen ligase family protein [Ktedonobacteraceae bacterium]